MKKQFSQKNAWLRNMFAACIMLMVSVPLFAQHPIMGPPGGNPPGNPNTPPVPPTGPNCHPQPCNAKFKFRKDSIANGIVFMNIQGTGAATYAWDFGDGSTSNVANPSHTYAAQGTYWVCLTVTDTVGGGCSNTRCDSVRVFTPPPHCKANFQHWLDSIPLGIRFRSKGGSPGATYAWDFGDGSTSNVQNPNHTYATAGTYWVCLTVTNTNASGTCSDTKCDSVHVFIPAPRCNAHFGAVRDTVANGVRFFSGPSSPGAAYAWDFGDGSTSSSKNPTHTYASAGTYYVCLIVSNSNAGGSCADTVCDSVNTNHPHPHGPMHFHKLGDSDNMSEATVAIYPNPMVDNATLHIENTSGNVTFRVFQINGQVVLTKNLGNGDYTLSKDNLAEGMYFYSVEDGNATVARGKFRVN